ncbi:MAG: hypothetical protein BA863_04080 [Desulfovibrio sp. S3730MH75]|nr:MAG: hypothetical protein BA863_04080 [Desulfovibrio sp. S3730MH75]
MTIRYITTGDEFKARGLFGEGRHQLTILKNAMSFQELEQLQRVVRLKDGTVIKCLSCFGQDVVNIFAVPEIPVKEKPKIKPVICCWCTDYFAVGTIKEVIGDYGDVGDYEDEDYPEYCNASDVAIKNYIGIRYKVHVCQGTLLTLPAWTEYICLSSDFAEYQVGDKVIVFMRGEWDGTTLKEPPKRDPEKPCKCDEFKLCIACQGKNRPGRVGDEADGSYLIMPLEIDGVNKQ